MNSSNNLGVATQPLVLKRVDEGPKILQHIQFKFQFDDEGNIVFVDL